MNAARAVCLLIVIFGSASSYAQTPRPVEENVTPAGDQSVNATIGSQQATGQKEVERLQGEVELLRAELNRLRSVVERDLKDRSTLATQASQAPVTDALPDNDKTKGTSGTTQRNAAAQTQVRPQSTAAPENRRIAVATKAQGGDLSGAGNLLRTDRLTIGGYGDFQFRQSSISERADGGGTPTFQNTRLVLGIAAVLAEKQNIVFNSEIEYEFGSKEIDVEQAYVEWKARPEFALRGALSCLPSGALTSITIRI
jgi:hypothetical protein